MTCIRTRELTLADAVPRLVAGRTGDLQLAHERTRGVEAALAGPTAEGVDLTLVHICRRRTCSSAATNAEHQHHCTRK